jgi:type I restriction enzyme R subunit
MSITKESAFESNIESHLLGNGWRSLAPAAYDRKLGVFGEEIIDFVRESQPKQWEQLVTRHGGEATAREKFLKVVVDALDHRGTISVLRSPVKDSGVSVRLCFFKPASGLNEEQAERYAANRMGVVRQLHHSESNPSDSLDLTLVVNGIPVAERRERDGAVPNRPQPERPDLPGPDARALRGRPAPRGDDDHVGP